VKRKRVVVTGMDVVTPVGTGLECFWNNLVSGKSGVAPVTRFDATGLPSRIGAEVKDFGAKEYLPPKLIRETDLFIQYALAAAQMAVRRSGLDPASEDPRRLGTVFGTSIGGIVSIAEMQEKIAKKPGVRVSPHFIPRMLTNLAAGQISIFFGFKGPSLTITTACASGADAVGTAMRLLREDRADVIIAGGSEVIICRLIYEGLCAARACSIRNDDPEKASRPFDRGRDGLVVGEGAGALVLETLPHALERGAPVLAELAGYANCGEGFHVMAPEADGSGEVNCIEQALADAGVDLGDIDYISAHGTSTPLGDRVEVAAINRVFGGRAGRIPVSSIKGATGHMMAASGAVELITCVQAIREGVLPPTINHAEPDPDFNLDFVPNKSRNHQVKVALSNSFGFGGQDACLVVKEYSR